MKSALIVESDCWSDSSRKQVDDMDEKTVGERLTRLEGNVEHLQMDVSDIKIELRRIDDKLTGKIDSLEGKVHSLRQELWSMKVWAIGLYVSMSGSLLFVMAKGFKWF